MCLPLLSFHLYSTIAYQFIILTVSFSCLLQLFELLNKLFHLFLMQLTLHFLLLANIFQLRVYLLQFCNGFFEFLLLQCTVLYKLGLLRCQFLLKTLRFLLKTLRFLRDLFNSSSSRSTRLLASVS